MGLLTIVKVVNTTHYVINELHKNIITSYNTSRTLEPTTKTLQRELSLLVYHVPSLFTAYRKVIISVHFMLHLSLIHI